MGQDWLLNNIKARKLSYFGHLKRHDSLEKHILEARLEGKRRKGRPTRRWTEDIKEWLQMSPEKLAEKPRRGRCLDGWFGRQRPHRHARMSEYKRKNFSSRFLKKKYLSYLQSHFPNVYNPEYKTYKLTDKLMKAFGNHIQFRQPNYKSELVFSKDVPKGAAIETAFEQASSEEKRLEEAALILRQEVRAVYANMPPLPWPPSSTYLLSKQRGISPPLLIFTKALLSSKKNSTFRLRKTYRFTMP